MGLWQNSGRPGVQRILAGLSIFAMLVSAIVLSVIMTIDPPAAHPDESTAKSANSSDAALVFYRTIGQTELLDPKEPGQVDVRFTIELAVTDSKDKAERLIGRYEARGVTAYYTPFSKDGKVLYRIRLGLYQSPAKAESDLALLGKERKLKGKVVRLQ